jgi:hypothetical protein
MVMSRWPGHNLLYSLLAQARNLDLFLHGDHLTGANGFVGSKRNTQTLFTASLTLGIFKRPKPACKQQ